MKTLFLLDAYALIYRAYYGFVSKPLVNSRGENTSAIFGFVRTLQEVIGGQKMPGWPGADGEGWLRPDMMAVCFDPHGGTFRHRQFPDYKAQRQAQPESITFAVPHIKQILEAYRIPILEVADYEADDVVGTVARLADAVGGIETYMMSPDKDYAQLVSDHTRIFKPKSFGPGYEVLGPAEVLAKYGLQRPDQVIDMLGLQGDTADNIPGCPGVGPKTAQKLIADFGSVDELLRQVDEAVASGRQELPGLKKSLLARIAAARRQIADSKYLATICRSVPSLERLDADGTLLTADGPVSLLRVRPDYARLAHLFGALEMRKMRDEAARQASAGGGQADDVLVMDTWTTSGRPAGRSQRGRTAGRGASAGLPDAAALAGAFDAHAGADGIGRDGSSGTDAGLDASAGAGSDGAGSGVAGAGGRGAADSEGPAGRGLADTSGGAGPDGLDPSATAGGAPLQTIDDWETHYIICDTPERRQELVATLSGEAEWAFDTETTSLSVVDAELVGLSFAAGGHRAWYVPVPAGHDEARRVLDDVRPLLESRTALKIAQNAKYDYSVLRRHGIEVAYPLFDTMVAHYLIEPERPHGMDALAETYLHYRPIPTSALIDTSRKAGRRGQAAEAIGQATLSELFDAAEAADGPSPEAEGQPKPLPTSMRDCAVADVARYCCEDGDVTYQLAQVFRPELQRLGLERLFCDVEMPMVRVLAEMELTGVRLDVAALQQSEDILRTELRRLDVELAQIAGHAFNPVSPKAVAAVLFDELQLAPKTKARSTAEDVLQQLIAKVRGRQMTAVGPDGIERQFDRALILDDILAYRGLRKLLGTYIDALPAEVNPATGRIHCQFNQTVTATGRLSSSNPNLQNIPIRDAVGREIRRAFVPDEGEVFFSADYSQIELRIMAHLSRDENMIEAFASGQDIHAATAAKIYHVDIADVTKEQRARAKTANFGIIYGISTFGLATRLNIPRPEAKRLIDGYFATFPRVKDYMEQAIAEARAKGYVVTLLGRRRYLPDIDSANGTVRGMAERNAINAPIQGTAADIIKVAMVRIMRRIADEGLHAKLLIQVHDELNFTVPPAELDRLRRLVLDEMAAAYPLRVPLIADCGSGANWLEAH